MIGDFDGRKIIKIFWEEMNTLKSFFIRKNQTLHKVFPLKCDERTMTTNNPLLSLEFDPTNFKKLEKDAECDIRVGGIIDCLSSGITLWSVKSKESSLAYSDQIGTQ